MVVLDGDVAAGVLPRDDVFDNGVKVDGVDSADCGDGLLDAKYLLLQCTSKDDTRVCWCITANSLILRRQHCTTINPFLSDIIIIPAQSELDF